VTHFDLVIIGTGSGNAIPDHFPDWKVAIVERDVFGGTCINRGCIPSKMYVVPADLAHDARRAAGLGLDITVNGVNWSALRDRVFGRIDPISASGRTYRATGSPNTSLIEGTARFVGPRVLDVDGATITADRILVAAGSRPAIPDVPGISDVPFHTSDTVMRLDALPERLGIIGGGVIATEMGHVFSSLGSAVTILHRADRLLHALDDDVANRITDLYSQRLDLRLGQAPSRIEQRRTGIVVHCGADAVEVDTLLVATGRRPNTDLLGCEAAGIDLRPDGRIAVDETMRTTVDGIWAIGDIANAWQLKHLANAEAKVAFWNMSHPEAPRAIDHTVVPAAVFGHPQIAFVGMTERAAREQGIDIAVGRRDFGNTAYGWALEDMSSFAKIIVDRKDGLIVGAHVIGPNASVLLQPIIQAMQFRQPATEVALRQLWIHPAPSEVIENALLDALDQS
jgi:mycothione reductase